MRWRKQASLAVPSYQCCCCPCRPLAHSLDTLSRLYAWCCCPPPGPGRGGVSSGSCGRVSSASTAHGTAIHLLLQQWRWHTGLFERHHCQDLFQRRHRCHRLGVFFLDRTGTAAEASDVAQHGVPPVTSLTERRQRPQPYPSMWCPRWRSVQCHASFSLTRQRRLRCLRPWPCPLR